MRAGKTILLIMVLVTTAALSACSRADITSRSGYSMVGGPLG